MVHKNKRKGNEKTIEWGFDLTDAKSDKAFRDLLKKYGFIEVSKHKPTDIAGTDGLGNPYTYELGNVGRFKSYHNTFVNPNGIRIIVQHMGGKGHEKGFLGYIGIKAPTSARSDLMNFLKDFRGSRAIKETDWMGKRGIVTYVKEETPRKSGFIGEK